MPDRMLTQPVLRLLGSLVRTDPRGVVTLENIVPGTPSRSTTWA